MMPATDEEWSETRQIGRWVVACCPECKQLNPKAADAGLFGDTIKGHKPECSRARKQN